MLKTVDYGSPYARPIVLCLGRYESLHRGHVAIINSAIRLADSVGAEVMLMTYDERDNPRFGRVILNFEERLTRLSELGVSSVMRIDFNEEFKSLSANDFLTTLKNCFDLRGIACGFDFRFGKDRVGNTDMLKDFFLPDGVPVIITDKLEAYGEKISTTAIRKFLEDGDIERANGMLGYSYFVYGKVTEGRRQGREMGFPTANLKIDLTKAHLKKGVYLTATPIDGVVYKGITNVGTAPTFDFSGELIEAHLDGYSGDLYGKDIKLEFKAYLRDIKKFSSVEELMLQLSCDLERLRED